MTNKEIATNQGLVNKSTTTNNMNWKKPLAEEIAKKKKDYTEEVASLRKFESEGKISLEQYEDITNDLQDNQKPLAEEIADVEIERQDYIKRVMDNCELETEQEALNLLNEKTDIDWIEIITKLETLKSCQKRQDERDKEVQKIKHYFIMKDKQIRYLCNQACGISEDKITNDYFDVTCKNCKEILNKDRISIEIKKALDERDKEVMKIIEGDRVQIARDWITYACDYYEVTKAKKSFTLDELYTIASKAFEIVIDNINKERIKQLGDKKDV